MLLLAENAHVLIVHSAFQQRARLAREQNTHLINDFVAKAARSLTVLRVGIILPLKLICQVNFWMREKDI